MSHYKAATHFDQYNGNEARLAKDEKDLAELEASLKPKSEETEKEQPSKEEEFKEAYSEVEIKAIDDKARRQNTAWAQKRFNEAQEAKKQLAEALAEKEKLQRQLAEAQLPRSDMQHSEWIEDNPESAAQVNTMIQKNEILRREELNRLRAELEELKRNNEQVEAEHRADAAYNALLGRVPDAPEILISPDFNEWLEDRPQMKNIMESGEDVPSAASVLELYKIYKAGQTPASIKKQKEQADIEAAAESVKGTRETPEIKQGPKIWKNSEVKSMSQKEYEALESEIDKAMSEGRFDYNS